MGEVLTIFKYVNHILFDKVINKTHAKSSAKELSKVVEYMMGQGLQYEVVRKREAELKQEMPTAKLDDSVALSEQYQ